MSVKVERLLVNYKTLDEFKKFKEYGLQELSMLEDLQANLIEDNSESPFYGIHYADKLIARMSLYKMDGSENKYFEDEKDYYEIWKLEVLPDYQRKGYGTMLVDFAKSFGCPLKTNPRIHSRNFWEAQGFEPVSYDMERDLGENPLIWYPEGVKPTA